MDLKTLRKSLIITGMVQGVGFRPFIYNLARSFSLSGFIKNTQEGVLVEVEGCSENIQSFEIDILEKRPALVEELEINSKSIPPADSINFEILASSGDSSTHAVVLPDAVTCKDCLLEVFAKDNRRYLYPFTNCTNCGPRYSIIKKMPYDRQNTSMDQFEMCPACEKEYKDPTDRRFHAEPNACPDCGPQMQLTDPRGKILLERHSALMEAVKLLKEGKVIALKGLGGFQLLVDATCDKSVNLLRERKNRPSKPFALMMRNLQEIKSHCLVGEEEVKNLTSSIGPIVLLEKRSSSTHSKPISSLVAPSNSCLGVMLPTTPLHHILLSEFAGPLVVTSGNPSGDPICTSEREALKKLQSVVDFFLIHNRSIVNHVDDSIVKIIGKERMILRRARGFALRPFKGFKKMPPTLALGADLKNTIAVTQGRNIILSPYIGNLQSAESLQVRDGLIERFKRYFAMDEVSTLGDLHPTYNSHQHLDCSELDQIQHHYAHLMALWAENPTEEEGLGVVWDGVGYGPDQTVWGSEFFLFDPLSKEGGKDTRIASLSPFRLIGGDQASFDPKRSALAILYEVYKDQVFEPGFLPPAISFPSQKLSTFQQMITRQLNSPLTSSMGRLFDGVSALLGIGLENSFEGEAAMKLQYQAELAESTSLTSYPFHLQEQLGQSPQILIDWHPMVKAMMEEVNENRSPAGMAFRFHLTLAKMVVKLSQKLNQKQLFLTGGCFQNSLLLQMVIQQLQDVGAHAHWPKKFPPNDGGISLGQIIAEARILFYQRELSLV